VAWRTLKRWVDHLEQRGEVLRIPRPVDVVHEAGAIADLLVKNDGPAVIFEQPRLADGSISDVPLVMNLFGSEDRTLRALGVETETAIGDRMVAMMKPDVPRYLKRPWEALPLAMDALAFAPKRKRRGRVQRIVDKDPDLTKLPIPTTWPMDGGAYITLPLVVTRDLASGDHNLGMYRSQIFGPKEAGLHWQVHKHGADHAAAGLKMPVAICLGGPPELIFSAISPLPDNLSEYQFAGILGRRRLPLTKAATQDLWIPSEADIVIEGWTDPTDLRVEGPFGDHYGFYSLTGHYPVLNVTAVTRRADAMLPATIVGLPPMEDGFLGEAIGRQFSPVLRFQHRDVVSVHLPLETGFHNLAIVASKQRYPRQGRKTAIGLMGAGQMMFLKSMVVVDPDRDPKDLEGFLDDLNDKVDPAEDVIVLGGMVADALEAASPYENVHDKVIIDATSIPSTDPRSGEAPLLGSFQQATPEWRRGETAAPGWVGEDLSPVLALDGAEDARLLRNSMLVVSVAIEGRPSPRTGSEVTPEGDALEAARQKKIFQLKNQIWQLEEAKDLRWLIITDDDLDLHGPKARRRMLWQLFCRFDVGRGLTFDGAKTRLCWDATTPIPSESHGVRRWPAVTLHSPETLEKVAAHPELADYSWPPHLRFPDGGA
jgi:4-hydroxy-3-polyprenylbenzoate decarboxylase